MSLLHLQKNEEEKSRHHRQEKKRITYAMAEKDQTTEPKQDGQAKNGHMFCFPNLFSPILSGRLVGEKVKFSFGGFHVVTRTDHGTR